MNPKYFANTSWSKKLADHFKDADWGFCLDGRSREWGLYHDFDRQNIGFIEDEYPAIHVGMVIEKLPKYTKLKKYDCGYVTSNTGKENIKWPSFDHENPVNALCELYNYLIENKLIMK